MERTQKVDGLPTESGITKPPEPTWGFVALFAAVLAVFGPVVTHGFVAWDDPAYITFNKLVHAWGRAPWFVKLGTPNLGYPVPLPVAIYALLGASAPAIHAVSLVLHLCNVALCFFLVRQWSGGRSGVGLAAAALWGLHPMVVESVAWATDLKEVSVAAAILFGAWCWEQALDSGHSRWIAATVVAAVVGALCKPTIVVLAPWLIARMLLTSERWSAPRSAAVLVVGAFSVVVATVAFILHHPLKGPGAVTPSRWIAMFAALGRLGRIAAWPFGLQPYYQHDLVHFTAWTGLGIVVAAAFAASLIWSLRSRSPARFALAFAFVCYLPYSNVTPLPRFVADTYLYVPGVGLIAALILALADRFAVSARRATLGIGFLALGLAVTSAIQVRRWRSTEALLGPLLGHPESFGLPYSLIAYERYEHGDVKGAVKLLDAAWPRLRHTNELPAFSVDAYLAAGRKKRAADAAVQLVAVLGPTPDRLHVMLVTLVRNDLQPPNDPKVIALVRRALTAEKSASKNPPAPFVASARRWAIRHGIAVDP